MNEKQAITIINSICRSGDKEANGCHLDALIIQFLNKNGYKDLAKEIQTVECYRA